MREKTHVRYGTRRSGRMATGRHDLAHGILTMGSGADNSMHDVHACARKTDFREVLWEHRFSRLTTNILEVLSRQSSRPSRPFLGKTNIKRKQVNAQHGERVHSQKTTSEMIMHGPRPARCQVPPLPPAELLPGPQPFSPSRLPRTSWASTEKVVLYLNAKKRPNSPHSKGKEL